MKRDKGPYDMLVREASDFWDEHDFSEFDDVIEVNDLKISLLKKKYVGIDMDIYKKLKKEAQRLHKTEGALIEEWLKERMSTAKG
jgi:hypothetical protein